MRLILFSFLIVTFTLSNAQERKSIHQIEWENHRHLKKSTDAIDVIDPNIIPLQKRLASGLSKKVFGFLPDWEYPGAMDNLRFDLLTHIAAFDFHVSPTGAISNPSGWPWTDLINEAHNNGVKVILTAVNFNGPEIHTIITNESVKNTFFTNLKNKITTYSLDGVNIDFESLNHEDRAAPINNFMAELTTYIHSNFPDAEVSFDGPAVNWSNRWDLAGLANSCDYIFIMGYAFAGSWSSKSGSTAPLLGGSINITNTVQTQYASVVNSMPEKLIIGVPYYGVKFQTATNEAHSSVVDYVSTTRFKTDKSNFENHGTLWDNETASPWYRYQDGGKWYQVWTENGQSMGEKFDLADSKSLLGVGMWALNYDGNQNDFWNQIIKHYGDGQPIPEEPGNFSVTSYSINALNIKFSESEFANGYWVYYSPDGLDFSDSTYFTSNENILTGLERNQIYFIKVRALGASGLGPQTGVLAATTNNPYQSTVLIVDGFDRQSGTENNRDYIRMHAHSFFNNGLNFSSATNEAVAQDKINLNDYEIVDWMLGDESTVDDTFSPAEQSKVKDYLENGGQFFVSGAEIGWDLARGSDADKQFYGNYLKAKYIEDAPKGENAEHYSADGIAETFFENISNIDFDDGTNGSFNVDWPDAIEGANGSHLGFKYSDVNTDNGGAGIFYSGKFGDSAKEAKLVYLAFPFETVYPEQKRDDLLSAVINFFDISTAIEKPVSQTPNNFYLLSNVPNPFNPSTKIRFHLPVPGKVKILIFNINGKLVNKSKEISFDSGLQSWQWHGKNSSGNQVASGTYFYKIVISSNTKIKKILNGKMTLIR
ncbi:MAG: T9SS C-terminal target domain-containing protein [Calditrichaeota bacterium]|nr:MAG: T9SS C-terminal target domain-containing protein [Calditrichota bacterium]MBL1204867.1 T9SS C-terminal target domain-containing protein [Calditrichota bacterium]NOG44696.1 T9SS type A sorting domain-containing protein [Calditrichota bacterium]